MQLNSDFTNKMKELLGDNYVDFENSLNQQSQKAITVNNYRLKDLTFENIADFKYKSIPHISNGYFVDNIGIGSHVLNHLGIIYSQEPSAMYPVEMLDIEEGDIVLDLCSAPGGKSIQILEKLNGTGLLVANEVVFNRVKILYENLNKMGFNNFVITCSNPKDFENLDFKFDKILVDAPCGGEGMIRKNNFDFASFNNSSIETNALRQSSILNSIKNILKSSGKLVYSTCTYDIRENEQIIVNFLKNNLNYELLDCPKLNDVTVEGVKIPPFNTQYCKRRYPHLFPGEGQFMGVMLKQGQPENICNRFYAKGFENIYKKDIEVLRKTFKDVANISNLNFIKRNDNIYVLPENIDMDFKDINVVTIGTLVGSIQNGTMKIAHEFYHTYGNLFNRKIELSKEQVVDYLKGYEIDIEGDTGICVVTHYGINLGGGKISQGRLKNYYPKNLRIN